jgi:hypothetical protein
VAPSSGRDRAHHVRRLLVLPGQVAAPLTGALTARTGRPWSHSSYWEALEGEQLAVLASEPEQIGVATLLDDLAVGQYIDPVRMPDPGQTMRDEEHAAAHDGREARCGPRQQRQGCSIVAVKPRVRTKTHEAGGTAATSVTDAPGLPPDGDRTVASRSYSGVTSAAGNAGDPDSAPTHKTDAAEVIRRADQRQHVLVRTLPGSGRGEPFRVVVLGCEVRVDPPLDVHVFPDREPLGHRHHGAQLAAEVAGDPERELRGPGVLGQRPDPDLEQQAEAARQPAEILGVRRRKAGGTHPVNNARVRRGCQG